MIVIRTRRPASVHAEQFGFPYARMVAVPRARPAIRHSRKPGSMKYSTGTSSIAFVLERGVLQIHRFDRRKVASAPRARRNVFPESACVIGRRIGLAVAPATPIAPTPPATRTAMVRMLRY